MREKIKAYFLKRQTYSLKGIIACTVLLGSALTAPTIQNAQAEMQPFSLKNIHKNISDDYKNVQHISRDQLMKALKAKDQNNYLIFDVREPDEFAVSHIQGAKLLLPSTWKSSFMKKYGAQIKGKKIIFYCSVGVRSTKMANYLKQSLKQQGAKGIYNLEEGIFGWANQGAPLVKSGNATKYTFKVHPYNKHWGQLIKDETLKSYTP